MLTSKHQHTTPYFVYSTSSCSSESSFSGLKRIKTALRSNMGNQRLTGLSLLHLHHDIPVDTSAVIDDFSCRYPRRMKLTNILED